MAQVSLSPAPLAPSLARSASPSFRLRSSSLNSVRLRRVFDLFDRNGDGEITVAELSLALDRLGLGAEPGELASAVAAFIRPGRSGLAYEDFEAFHGALGEALFGDLGGEGEGEEEGKAEEEEDMREAFKVFDEDGDGFISARELQAVLEKLGMAEGRSAERVRQMICSVDRDSDGRVDFGEFKQMMRNVQVDGA